MWYLKSATRDFSDIDCRKVPLFLPPVWGGKEVFSLTAEEQTKQMEAKALLTLDVVSRDVRCLVDALHLLAEADMGRFKYGRRAIGGVCYGIEEAMSDLDLADYHLNG